MSYTVKNLLAIAAAQIGYHEKNNDKNLDSKTAANDGSGNHTKFARDLHAAGYYNGDKCGYAWCDVFVDWCFYQLCNKDPNVAQQIICQTGPYGAGCLWSARYYRAAGRYHTSNPQPGDQIFFGTAGDEEHTGIVESVSATTITTIEGNTSNQVARRTYAINSSYVSGFGRPRYDTEEETPVSPTPDEGSSTIHKGDVVSIISGATYYSGAAVPQWVRAKKWIVREVSGDRAVIDKSADGKNAICSPIHVKFLAADVSAEPTAPAPTPSAIKVDYARSFNKQKAGKYTVQANGGLHLRSGANTDKTSLEVMPDGSKVTCYGYSTGEWLYVVSASGKKGFCHSAYLKKV